MIGDGIPDTATAINVNAAPRGYAGAGLACVMIEKTSARKKPRGQRGRKEVVDRAEAGTLSARPAARATRRADFRDARTDARATDGLDEGSGERARVEDAGATVVRRGPRDERKWSALYSSALPQRRTS